jgi:hypothetical protein
VVVCFAVESLNESGHNGWKAMRFDEQRNPKIIQALVIVRIDPMFE